MLKITKVNKIYQSKKLKYQALKDISLTLPDKGFFAILGPSGCGKTTLLNIIGGMDLNYTGNVNIDGVTIDKTTNFDNYRKDTIGFVFQHAILLNSLTVFENVSLPLKISSQDAKVITARVNEILKLLGILDLKNRKVNTLSGGQKQRVVIARALINNPKIILADEPTGQLDSKNAKIILSILQKLSSERLIIMVTHEEKYALEFADKIIKMKDGRLVEVIHNQDNVKQSNLTFALTPTKKTRRSVLPFKTSLKLAIRSLSLHKFRNFFTALGLSIGLTGIALSLALTNGFQDILKQALSTISVENYAEIMQLNHKGKEMLDRTDFNIIINNIDSSLAIPVYNYYLHYEDEYNYKLLLNDKSTSNINYQAFLKTSYIDITNKMIVPTLTSPLQNNQLLIGSSYQQEVCQALNLEACDLNSLSDAFHSNPITIKILENNNKTAEYQIVGMVYNNFDETFYHTNPNFSRSFVIDQGLIPVYSYKDFGNKHVMELMNLYVIDVGRADALYNNLYNNEALLDYDFFLNVIGNQSYYTPSLVYYKAFTYNHIVSIVSENKTTTTGFAYPNFFTKFGSNGFSFTHEMFLSNDKEVLNTFVDEKDYLSLPLSSLPSNLLHSQAGNTFSFRPINAHDISGSKSYFNIIGNIPAYDDINKVVISKGMADKLLKGSKDYESLLNTKIFGNVKNGVNKPFELTISGIAKNETGVYLMHDGYFSFYFLSNLLDISFTNTRVNEIYLFTKDNISVQRYINQLETRYKNLGLKATNQVAEIMSIINDTVVGIRNVLIALSSITILVAVFLISMVSFITTYERRQEVGILRTMGSRKLDISILFLNEAGLLGLMGALLALLGTYLISLIVNSIFNAATRIISLSSTKSLYIMIVDYKVLLLVLVVAIIISMIASLLPILTISRIDPVESLKKK